MVLHARKAWEWPPESDVEPGREPLASSGANVLLTDGETDAEDSSR